MIAACWGSFRRRKALPVVKPFFSGTNQSRWSDVLVGFRRHVFVWCSLSLDGKNQRRYPPLLCLLQRLEDNVQMSLPLDLRYGDIQCSLTEVHPGCETRFSDNGADGRSRKSSACAPRWLLAPLHLSSCQQVGNRQLSMLRLLLE